MRKLLRDIKGTAVSHYLFIYPSGSVVESAAVHGSKTVHENSPLEPNAREECTKDVAANVTATEMCTAPVRRNHTRERLCVRYYTAPTAAPPQQRHVMEAR